MSGSSNWGAEIGPERPKEGKEPEQIGLTLLADAVRRRDQALRNHNEFAPDATEEVRAGLEEELFMASEQLSKLRAELIAQGHDEAELARIEAEARQRHKRGSEDES